jgi:16S rRNA (uracil1498-N3)-methyltransferase
MQLFYQQDINTGSKQISFNKEESRHIVKVLRKINGDILSITDGKGILFSAEIIQAHDKKCIANIKSWEAKPKTWNYHLHIAIAPTKLNDRFEWFLEKATEIGIDEITPVFCDHSERRQLKAERMEKVITSAMKQSLKFNKPVLNDPMKFTDFIQKKDWDLGLIAHCEDDLKNHLRAHFPFHQKIMILIGPEGDFSLSEINAALKNGIQPITLGKSRLRTETAGIVACNYVSVLNEIL